MKSIKKKTQRSKPLSPYKGGEKTYEDVKEKIRLRYGDEAAESFNPYNDAMPYTHWAAQGYQVKKGEHAIKTYTVIEYFFENERGEHDTKTRRVPVNLFYKTQVTKN